MDRDRDPFPPLISRRSPSYERAWREFPHPTEDQGAETVALLARLSEAEQNASQACAQLAPLLEDDEAAEVVRDVGDLHAARRQALAKLIERCGGSAPTDRECRDILTQTTYETTQARTAEDAGRALDVLQRELAAEYATARQSPHLDEAQRDALAALAPEPIRLT